MSELLREAILGTAHTAARAVSAADGLIGKLSGIERERVLLLSAAAEALARRAGRLLPERRSLLPVAEPEMMRVSSLQLTAAVRVLLEEGGDLLHETLVRMARAGVRLAPELLPLALEQSSPALRELLRPVLGHRGAWLAQTRSEWTWARADVAGEGSPALPSDFLECWSDGNAAERRRLFALLRAQNPARGRELAAEAWKHERAEQRAAFAEAFAIGLSPDDQAFLSDMLADRSAFVQRTAARLLWRLPSSEVAARMLARARAHVRFKNGTWSISLPPEPLDPSWMRDGIAEKPPDGGALGKRQWWLQQLIAAVPCASWVPPAASAAEQVTSPQQLEAADSSLAGVSPAVATAKQPVVQQLDAAVSSAAELPPAARGADSSAARLPPPIVSGQVELQQLLAAAAAHEFAGALLDGLTRAALQYDEHAWFAPLWDAWAKTHVPAAVAPDPRVLLSAKLTAREVAARAPQLVSDDKLRALLLHLPRPWPEPLALRVLSAIADLRPAFRDIIPVAALAIPVALLPDALPLPEIKQVELPLRAFVRALADFQEVAALRRTIAAETTGDD